VSAGGGHRVARPESRRSSGRRPRREPREVGETRERESPDDGTPDGQRAAGVPPTVPDSWRASPRDPRPDDDRRVTLGVVTGTPAAGDSRLRRSDRGTSTPLLYTYETFGWFYRWKPV